MSGAHSMRSVQRRFTAQRSTPLARLAALGPPRCSMLASRSVHRGEMLGGMA